MSNRQHNTKIALGDLGIYDGPPIGSTQADERARARIIRASKQLASTINYLGLRP